MKAQRRKDSKGRVLRKGEYERKNGTYMFVYKNCMSRKCTIYAPTLKELRAKSEKVTLDILDGIDADGAQATINEMYERWKTARKLDVEIGALRDSTFRNYCYMYEQFVKPSFGNIKLKDVTTAKVEAFYKFLVVERGLKVHSVEGVNVPLKQVFQLAVDSNYIRSNPVEGAMRRLKAVYQKKEMGLAPGERALTLAQQELFMAYLQHAEQYKRWEPLFTVLLYTGMRIGELTGLRWCDVDEKKGFIDVNHTLVYYDRGGVRGNRCKYAVNDTKTPSGKRSIPMLPIVLEAFHQERERQKREGVTSRMVVDGYRDFVFVNRFGDCLNQSTVNKAIRRIVRDCNFEQLDKGNEVLLPMFSCHWLRHTFATRMVENNVNVKAMQSILGHADIRTTLNIYASAQDDFTQDELAKLTN